MITDPDPLKYTVHSTDHGLTWRIEPPVFDILTHRGPFPRWRDAYDHAATHVILNRLRPGAISEEGFHVDSAE